MRRAAIALALIAATSAAVAGAPDTSPRPVARPSVQGAAPSGAAVRARPLYTHVRPQARPPALVPPQVALSPARAPAPATPPLDVASQAHPSNRAATAGTPPTAVEQQARSGLFSSLRPLLRPLGMDRQTQERKRTLARGAVCGDADIQGEEVGRVPGRISGCGIEDAVKVRSINGIALSQQALMDCQTARTIKAWMQKGMAPAVGNYGGGVSQLHVAAHYSCRARNNQKGAKVSEHGKGHAIDIAGFRMRDGRSISVLQDWGGGAKGRILQQMHRSACGPFGTVLGPNSDRFHRDHFHFDTARYRSGSYCR
ncbi:extensin-like protein [Pelagivirga sediminicola]|uniref:Extensin-like protein n=1 Tax=Pelagivirga sediminicola TaxID=2170575 RepID=A0A2T7G632_9RHOB|nr:extensin family protein [Pelagivirga sediminicola]PVA09885.1 extensin-like protein [Pelagivirga sediminicola]